MRANKPQSLQLITRKRKKDISECFQLFLQSHMFMNQSFLQHSQHRIEQSLFSCRWCLHIAVCRELFEVFWIHTYHVGQREYMNSNLFSNNEPSYGAYLEACQIANHRRRGMCRVKISLLEYALKHADTHSKRHFFFFIIYEQLVYCSYAVEHLMGPLVTSLISPFP